MLGARICFQLRTNSLATGTIVARWCQSQRKELVMKCYSCNNEVDETCEHIFMECPRFESLRLEFLLKLEKLFSNTPTLNQYVRAFSEGIINSFIMEKTFLIQSIEPDKELEKSYFFELTDFLSSVWKLRNVLRERSVVGKSSMEAMVETLSLRTNCTNCTKVGRWEKVTRGSCTFFVWFLCCLPCL